MQQGHPVELAEGPELVISEFNAETDEFLASYAKYDPIARRPVRPCLGHSFHSLAGGGLHFAADNC